MPVVSQIVEIDGKKYLDGALADSIPVRFLERKGYVRNIAVLTRPGSFIMKPNKQMTLIRILYRKYPRFIDAVESRHRMYNETLAYISQLESAGKLLVLRPESPLPVKRVEKDPDKLKQAYEIGREIALRRLDEIKVYLNV